MKMIFRQWGRNRVNTFISFAGLIVGLTCSLMLILFVMNEYRIATALNDSRQVYLLQVRQHVNEGESEPESVIRGEFADYLKARYPAIGSDCLISSPGSGNGRLSTDMGELTDVCEVSPSFADYFAMPVLRGDLRKTLSAPNEVALAASEAEYLFGEQDPIGQKVVYEKNLRTREGGSVAHEKYVTCLIDDSRQGLFSVKALIGSPDREMLLSRKEWGALHTVFIRLSEHADYRELERTINDGLSRDPVPSTVAEGVGMTMISAVELVPLNDIYFTESGNELFASRDPMLLYIGSLTALLILLIACFNYVNLAMACAPQRLRNMAGQRIMGASRGSIRRQAILETLIHVALCLVVSLYLIFALLPDFNRFLWCDIRFADIFLPGTLGLVLLLLSGVTLLPSAYILWKLETDSLLVFLKRGETGRSYMVRGLVVAQFAISTVLIVVCLNIYRQIGFMFSVRPMSDRIVGVTMPPFGLENGGDVAFRDRVTSLPSIEEIRGKERWSSVDSYDKVISRIVYIDTDPGYFGFNGIELVAGRDFTATDSSAVILSRTVADLYGMADPVGKTLELNGTPYKVVGLVRDLPENLHLPADPTVYRKPPVSRPLWQTAFVIKAVPGQTEAAVEGIRQAWEEVSGMNRDLLYIRSVADEYRERHQNDLRISKMVLTFTIISVLLSMMGLFGLAWYSVNRRRKEIALRKVHGATSGEVTGMLCRGFLGWIAVSLVVALPLAWYFSEMWFRRFAYKPDLGVWVFALGSAVVCVVGLATVFWQSRRAALRDPARSVRTE